MYFKILKKDLKRKKSINVILLIFVMLATIFISASVNNFIEIMSGVNDFTDVAEVGDYLIITMSNKSHEEEKIENPDKNLVEFIEENENVDSYTVDKISYLSDGQIDFANGEKFELSSSVLLQSVDAKQQNFYDVDNKEVDSIKPGHIYVCHKAWVGNDLKAGDKIIIHTKENKDDEEYNYYNEFIVDGYVKDATLGSDLMGVERYIFSQEDFEKIYEESSLPHGNFYSMNCNDTKGFSNDYTEFGGSCLFSCDKSLVKISYLMDMIIAGILIIVSIVLIAISVIMLRFTIIFTVNEDFKEIGIMKAIGIKDSRIRKIYLVKYFGISVVGGILGFFASIPFSRLMIKQVTDNIVIEGGNQSIILQAVLSVAIVFTVAGFGYLSTKRIKKVTPLDAIRSGNNGERFKKGKLKLSGTRKSVTSYLALNDVISELKKYIILAVASILGIWLVIMPVNTINTLTSDSIAPWFGVLHSDLLIGSDEDTNELIKAGTKQAILDYLDEIEAEVESLGYKVERTSTETYFRLKVRHGENTQTSFSLQGIKTNIEDYQYDDGTAPKKINEVALSKVTADKIEAEIGDTVYITLFDKEETFVVTAIYQSMNNLGEGIRFTNDVNLPYEEAAGVFGCQIYFEEDYSASEIKDIQDKLSEIMPDKKVETTKEFIGRQIGGVSDKLKSLKVLILVIVILINILVVMLMQKMFLVRERGEMAMMKSLGFSNKAIIWWQTKRIMLVLFVGIVLGSITANFFTKITSGQVFKFMGASNIKFVINIPEVVFIYPIAIFVSTVIACIITMLKVRKISVQEANTIE